jgi:hypothetical protein
MTVINADRRTAGAHQPASAGARGQGRRTRLSEAVPVIVSERALGVGGGQLSPAECPRGDTPHTHTDPRASVRPMGRLPGGSGPGDRRAGHHAPADRHVVGDAVAQLHQGGRQPVEEHHPGAGHRFDRLLARPIGQPCALARPAARAQLGDQLRPALRERSGHPAVGDSSSSGRAPRHTTTLPRPPRAGRPADHAPGRQGTAGASAVRSRVRRRARVGPMLPTGMPSRALISS